LGTILPQYWQRYTTTILANIVGQYWANVGHKYWTNVGHKYWTDIGKTRCTILAQYSAQYCPNIGSATQRQYWPILLNNIGPMLAINIGPILVKYAVQYWPKIGHNIAPILAALHNDNIGQYC